MAQAAEVNDLAVAESGQMLDGHPHGGGVVALDGGETPVIHIRVSADEHADVVFKELVELGHIEHVRQRRHENAVEAAGDEVVEIVVDVLCADADIDEVASGAGSGLKMQDWMRGYLTYVLPLIVVFIFAFGLYDKFLA